MPNELGIRKAARQAPETLVPERGAAVAIGAGAREIYSGYTDVIEGRDHCLEVIG